MKYKNIDIWIVAPKATSSKEFEIYNSLIDCLRYWLSELDNIVGDETSEFEALVIEFKLTAEIRKYFEVKYLSEIKIEDNIKRVKVHNKITLNINDRAFGLFAYKSNKVEKAFSLMVLEIILGDKFININKEAIDKVFMNSFKKNFLVYKSKIIQ